MFCVKHYLFYLRYLSNNANVQNIYVSNVCIYIYIYNPTTKISVINLYKIYTSSSEEIS